MHCKASCCKGANNSAVSPAALAANETQDASCRSETGEACDPDCHASERAREGSCNVCCEGEQEEEPSARVTGSQDARHSRESLSKTNCDVGCCGASHTGNAQETAPTRDKSCAPETTDMTCCKSRCGGEDKESNNSFSCLEGCTSTPTESECKTNCCSNPTPPTEDPETPICCKGKPSPCCDESCLDRIALRECNGTTKHPTSRSTSAGCGRGQNGSPCEGHSRATCDRYLSTLEALGCICRALLALGDESCCAPSVRPSADRKKRGSRASVSSDSAARGSCCASGVAVGGTKAQARSRRAVCAASQSGCSNLNICSAMTCVEEMPRDVIVRHAKGAVSAASAGDVEKGVAGLQHVVLSVSGMTCTGCETKLQRVLASLNWVTNVRTSLVLARAEMDVELSAGSVPQLIKHLQRTTEFTCTEIGSRGSSIDVVVSGTAADYMKRDWPTGVLDMKVVDAATIRVSFDDKIIGARDLVEKGWDEPSKLAPLRADHSLAAGSKHIRHIGYKTLLSIVLTIPVRVLAWASLPNREVAYASASLALATIIQFYIAGPFYPKALKSLVFSRMIEMDLLIVLSTSAAYIFSVVSFGYLVSRRPLSTGQFFETSTLLVTLIMIGRFVAALAHQKAVKSVSIRSTQSSTATLVGPNGYEREIDIRLLQYGDTFRVAPDVRVPTDGTVVSGSSDIDESMLTGESIPVVKRVGSTVAAGSINGSGTLNVRLARLPSENTISVIAGMVDQARMSKPKIQDIADRVASYFVPVVVALTCIVFCTWIGVGVSVRNHPGSEATIEAITYAITVLIVSCPCAIGLAVPMVILIASGIAAEHGVIFKSASSIEVSHKPSHVIFDKTGTLTQGKLDVAVEEYMSSDVEATKSRLLGLVGSIKHPVSAAVSAHLKAQGVSADPAVEPKTVAGKGRECSSSGCVLRAGNSRWLGFCSDPRVEPALSRGYTVFCFTVNGTLAAVFGLRDSLRADALSTVQTLSRAGICVHIVSGDDEGAVRSVANQLDIPDAHVRSRASPADKQAYVQRLLDTPDPSRTSGFFRKKTKQPVVIFCGDGTNDAVALTQATVGVHMNEGSDVAQSAADVVLTRPNLAGVLSMIAISRMSIRRIAFNFGWSFAYNLFAILLAAGAFVYARIPPKYAGLGELVSVLPVILAAVSMRFSKIEI